MKNNKPMDFTQEQANNIVRIILLTAKGMMNKVSEGQLNGASGITESVGEIGIGDTLYQLQISFQSDRRNFIDADHHVLNFIKSTNTNN